MKARYRRSFAAVVVVAAIGAALSLPISVTKRITFIDLSTIYPKIQDYNEGRDGYVMKAGEYPSMAGIGYYYFETPRGSIALACSLDDFDSWIASRHKWERGQTSQPIGEEAFFKNETESEETLELAFRRHNICVCFRNHPKREYRGGRPVFTTDTDKKELEEAARILDDAIRRGSPNIKVEDVRVYQVVGYNVKSFVGGGLWLLYSLFHPNARM